MSIATTWRGQQLNESLLKRGLLPLLDPWSGQIKLYRSGGRAQLSDQELANVWVERTAIGEYLRRLA